MGNPSNVTTTSLLFTFWSLYPLELPQYWATDRVEMQPELQPQNFMLFRSLIIYLSCHISCLFCPVSLQMPFRKKSGRKTEQWLLRHVISIFVLLHHNNCFFKASLIRTTTECISFIHLSVILTSLQSHKGHWCPCPAQWEGRGILWTSCKSINTSLQRQMRHTTLSLTPGDIYSYQLV